MARRALIDGDLLAYRCSAANTRRFVTAIHKETLEQDEFDNVTKFREWLKANDLSQDDFTVTPGKEPGPIAFALKSIKGMIEDIKNGAGCEDYHIIISGKNNFRLELPLPSKYKGTRDDDDKPPQLEESKQYLITHHGAEVTEGEEADDRLCAYAYQSYRDHKAAGTVEQADVQCSIDKDAKHGSWWLYDWTTMDKPQLIEGFGELTCTLKPTSRRNAKGEVVNEKIIKGYGRIWLYFQMLFGDPVDAYKPCEIAKAKFGDVGAYNLLVDAKTDKEALQVLVNQYRRWYAQPTTYTAWDGTVHTKTWLEIMQMYADCAHMRRWPGDRLNVEKLLKKLGVAID